MTPFHSRVAVTPGGEHLGVSCQVPSTVLDRTRSEGRAKGEERRQGPGGGGGGRGGRGGRGESGKKSERRKLRRPMKKLHDPNSGKNMRKLPPVGG